jgi:hypothetical protein
MNVKQAMGHCHPIPLSSMIQEMSRDATGTDSLELPNIYKTKQKILPKFQAISPETIFVARNIVIFSTSM